MFSILHSRSRQKKAALLVSCVLLSLSAGLLLSGCKEQNAPLETVTEVDLERYAGKWYEIARLPQRFEKGCHCVTAEYKPQPDGGIEVLNSCRQDSPTGKLKVAKGKAVVQQGTGNAQLRVQFFWPFRGDYWILDLDPDYRWAVVGSPDREYLWILSRSPELDPALLQKLVAEQKAKGFPVELFEYTNQQCGDRGSER